MTYQQSLNHAVRLIRQAGSISPEADGWALLCRAAGRERAWLMAHGLENMPPDAAERYEDYIARRCAGEPVAYITGHREFMSLDFAVGEGILIPRPDTETLVEFVLEHCGNVPQKMIDICTGSGCVAVSLAHYLPAAQIIAADVSACCVETARRNAAANGVAEQVEVVQWDIFAPPPIEMRFDCMVSNPPYIRPVVIETLAREVKEYEPRIALDGGADGLQFYRRLLELAPLLLEPGGLFAVEIGYDQAEDLLAMLADCGLFAAWGVERDLAGNDRVVWGR